MDPLVSRIKQVSAKEYEGIGSCVIAFSGGIDSLAVGHILTELGIDVTPLAINMGNSDFEAAAKLASKVFGKAKTADMRPRLRDALLRAIKTNSILAGHLNSGGITRPLLAQALSDTAISAKIGCVAHGSSGVGNDHIRMELSLRVLAPELRVIAPVRDWDLKRSDSVEYAKRMGWKHDDNGREFSTDENLWARVIRQGSIVQPDLEAPTSAFKWVSEKPQKEKTTVEIVFENGKPTHAKVAQGRRKAESGWEGMLELLNAEGGEQGIGRRDVVVEKIIGLKMREIHECPAATMLVAAHADLERLTLTSSEIEAKAWVDRQWNKLVYDGGWFTRLRRDLDAFVDATQEAVDGTVKIEIHNGAMKIVGRNSPRALYDTRLGSRDKSGVLNQRAAAGFVKLYGLQDTMAYLMRLE